MSADDFQNKYSSVMESMLKSAIAETTKLFETMVNELKAEISQIKKENEDLKTRCIQYEIAKDRPVKQTRERSTPEQIDCSTKCDTAIQCAVEKLDPNFYKFEDGRCALAESRSEAMSHDLGPCRTVLVEQCPPLGRAELQNQEQQYANARMNYNLLEHNYVSKGEPLVDVKKEQLYCDAYQQCVVKEEEVESPVVSRQVTGYDKGSKEPFVANDEAVIEECFSEEIQATQINEATEVVSEPQTLEMESSLKHAQNQSHDSQNSLVISLKDAFNSCFKDEREAAQKVIKGLRQEELTHEKHLDPQKSHLDNITSVNKENKDIAEHAGVHCAKEVLAESVVINRDLACEAMKEVMNEREACPEPTMPAPRRRGRPPKKKRGPRKLPSTDVPKSQKSTNNLPEREDGIESTPGIAPEKVSSSKPPEQSPAKLTNTFSVSTPLVNNGQNKVLEDEEAREVASSVSVETLNHSLSSEKQTLSETQRFSREGKNGGTKTQISGKTPDGEMQGTPKAISLPTLCHVKEPCSSARLQDAMLLIEAMNQSTSAIPQTQNTKPQMQGASLEATLGMVDKGSAHTTENKQRQPPRFLVKLGASNKTQRTIIIVPKLGPSLICKRNVGLPLPQSSKVVLAAERSNVLKIHIDSHSKVERPILNSAHQKTFNITCNKQSPVLPLQATTISTEKPLKMLPQQKTISPGQEEFEIKKPGIINLRANQDATESTAPALLESSTQLMPMSEKLTPTNLDRTALSEKINDTTGNRDFPKPAMHICKTRKSPTKTCSTLETSNGLEVASAPPVLAPTTELKHCAVVRLTRLPLQVSTQKSISVSRVFPNGYLEDVTQRPLKTSMLVSATSVLIPPKMGVNSLHVADEPKRPFLLKEAPAIRDLLPSMSSSVSEPVVEKPNAVSGMMDPSPVPTTPDEVTFNLSPIVSKERQKNPSSDCLQLTSISPKDSSYPQLSMTKTQFLAQLSVSPVVQVEKTSTFNSADSSKIRTSSPKSQQAASIVSRLRSHMKNFLKTRRATGQKHAMEMEATSKSPKQPRLENDRLNDKNPTEAVCNGKLNETDTLTSTDQADATSGISSAGSSRCEIEVTTSDEQPVSLSYRPESPSETAVKSLDKPSSSRHGVDPNTIPSTSVSPWPSTSTEGSGISEMTKLVSSCLKRDASYTDDASLRDNESRSVTPQRPSSVKESNSPEYTRVGFSPKTTKPNSTSPNRLTRETSVAKMSESPGTCALTRNGLEMPGKTVGSTYKKADPSDRSMKRESSSFSPESHSGSQTNIEPSTLVARGPYMVGNCVSPERTEVSTSNKPTLGKHKPPKTGLKATHAMKLTKTAKAKRKGKMKRSNKSKRRVKLEESQINKGEGKKCRAKVWYPPKLPPNEVPSTEMRKPPPVVVEDKIPNIPFNQAPIVSPLQPLAVIGKHLLRNQCGQCGRVFGSNAALESHVSLHAGYRLFSCSLCGKSFPDTKTFKRHDRVHRNGRIHICHLCGKGFVYRFGLSKHLQMVHTRIKPFICQVCNKGFFSKRDVEVHVRIHTGEKPFHCHLCEKKFTRRVELNVHLRWHNGEKRYWCPYCGKGFLDLNNMKRHRFTHTGEKPHSCPRCHKRFTQGAHVKKHLRNVHKEN